MVISAQLWFYDSQVIKILTRDKDPPLQPVRPTQILLACYGLEDTYKRGFGSGLSVTKEVGDGMEDGPGRVQARHGFSCEENQSKSSNNRELMTLLEVVEEEADTGRTEGVEKLLSNRQLCGRGRLLSGYI